MDATPRSSFRLNRVIAVVVTHNRLALLKNCVNCLRLQSVRPDQIIVVNNGSTDGTTEWLKLQCELKVINKGNLGGAGGFCVGLKSAHLLGSEWFWIMDDDTFPETDALAKMLGHPQAGSSSTGFLSSIVLWTDGTAHQMNIPCFSASKKWISNVLECRSIPVTHSSFVSLLVHRRALEYCGLPLPEFFVWLDDVEFTSRITQTFNGHLILDSKVVHATPENKGMDFSSIGPRMSLKEKCGVRNQVYLCTRGHSSWIKRHFVFMLVFLRLCKSYLFKIPPSARIAFMRACFDGLFFKVDPTKSRLESHVN